MKKNIFFIVSGIIILLFTTSLILPSRLVKNENFIQTETDSTIPDSINAFLKNSCAGCHANGGSAMAMSKLNLSEWDTYTSKKQASKAEAIYTEVSEEKMPPKKVRKEHPELIPTQAQVESLLKWSNSLNSKL